MRKDEREGRREREETVNAEGSIGDGQDTKCAARAPPVNAQGPKLTLPEFYRILTCC